MTPLKVDCSRTEAGWSCAITVGNDAAATRHEVTVTDDVLARLAPDDVAPTRLVHDAFEFLLAREPRESIMRRFELSVIGRYFPEWDDEIRKR